MLKNVFVKPFPRAKRSFGARGALIRSSSRLWRWTSSRVAEETTTVAAAVAAVLQNLIDNTHSCHRMTVRAAGGRRTGCATPNRCEQQQQQQQRQQQQCGSSQANIGAVVGCDRVFCGVVKNAVGLDKLFDRAIRPAHPVGKVDFLDGMCGSDCSI